MRFKREILLIGLGCIVLYLLLLTCNPFDITPPEVRFLSPANGEQVYLSCQIEIEAKDKNLKRVELYDNGNWIKNYENGNITEILEFSEGNHTLIAKAFDKGGQS